MEISTGLSPGLQEILEVDEITDKEIEAMHRETLGQIAVGDVDNQDVDPDWLPRP